MVQVLSTLLPGISVGGQYALIALGYTMVYGILRLINFAHGDIFTVAGFVMFYAVTAMPVQLAIPLTIAVTVLLGFTVERLAYKPLRSAPRMSVMISAIGVSYLLQNSAQLLWGADTKTFRPLVEGSLVLVPGQLSISYVAVLSIVCCVVVMITLTLFTGQTKLGKAMRACSEDKAAAQLMGIDVNATISMTFAIGSALAAIAGVLMCSAYPVLSPTTGSMPGIRAFTAAVFGGIGSVPGALLGGILLGVIETFAKAYISTDLSDAVVFAVLIVVLLVKPAGLMGKYVPEKV